MQKIDGISTNIMDLLICPVTHGKLVFDENNMEFISNLAKLAYPIIDGIPHLDATKARMLEDLKDTPNAPSS